MWSTRLRLDRRRLALVAIVAVVALAPVAWVAVARGASVSDGTVTDPVTPPWGAGGADVFEVVASESGLRPGDRVTAIDGVPLAAASSRRSQPAIGERLVYSVVRDGESIDLPVTVTEYRIGARVAAHVSAAPLVLLMVLVASFVFLRRPDDGAARALFATTAAFPFGATAFPLGTQVIDLVAGPRLWPALIGDLANCVTWGALLNFALVFPDGRPARRWLVPAAYATPFVLAGVYLLATLPGTATELERWSRFVTPSLLAGRIVPFLIAAAIAAAYRRASDAQARQRLLWVTAALMAMAAVYLGLGQIPALLTGRPAVPWDWIPVLWAPFPLVLGAAVLRYRLFDIRLIIRRSLVYGSLTAVLVGLYVALVLLLTSVVDLPSSVSALVATAVVAVLFQPLRDALRRWVGRLVFGARDDPYEVITQLGRQLQARASSETILGDLAAALANALRLPYVAVEVMDGGQPGPDTRAEFGERAGEQFDVDLRHRGELVGRLELDPGPTREPFGAADRALLDAVGRQVAAAANDVVLTRRLQRSLERVVTAREEERRRLRRDIHDGIGPTLAAAAMRLEVARRSLRSDPELAAELLEWLAGNQQSVIADLRQMVNGLRPPVLDQLGLASALEQQVMSFAGDVTTSSTRIRLDIRGDVEPLPAAVEVAAYHIVRESLANVVRHSGADDCVVGVEREPGCLLLRIRDDGSGLPARYRAGVGLNSIRERTAELGGSVEITGAAGAGTEVRVRLPFSEPEPGQARA